jgi:hypothetical protein
MEGFEPTTATFRVVPLLPLSYTGILPVKSYDPLAHLRQSASFRDVIASVTVLPFP